MPLKIDFDGTSEQGHSGAYPVGTLTNVYLDGDVIRAKSVLWNSEFPKEDKYLKTATAEGRAFNTSWELLYAESENVDIQLHLRGIQFLGTVIVKNPAYDGRTPILSIAEKTESGNMEEELNTLRDQLYWLLSLCDDLYYDVMEVERQGDAVANASTIGERLKEVISTLNAKKQNIADMTASMASVTAEKEELSAKLLEATQKLEKIEADKAEAEAKAKLEERKTTLAQYLAADEIDEELLSLEDTAFTKYIGTLEKVMSKAKASHNAQIPEPYGKVEYGIRDIANSFKENVRGR